MIMRVITHYRARIKELRAINEAHREINGRLREENKELREQLMQKTVCPNCGTKMEAKE